MHSRVKVPENIRLGIAAEGEIGSRLGFFAKVSKEDLDVGLDFRCELLENESPSTPFFVQATGTRRFSDK